LMLAILVASSSPAGQEVPLYAGKEADEDPPQSAATVIKGSLEQSWNCRYCVPRGRRNSRPSSGRWPRPGRRRFMATTMCDVCGVRPAVVTVRRMVPGQSPRIENLCEVHAAEARGGRSSFGRSPLGGGSLFDEFFGGFFDEEPSVPRARGRVPPSARQAEQIDITRFFSDSMQELVQRAARKAVEWGSLDLTGEHLLWAALQDGVMRRVLEGAGADADQIGAQLEDEAERGDARKSPLPSPLTPSAPCSPPTRSRGRSAPHT
jgi:hypothetical protein